MAATGPGGMLAVAAGPDQVTPLLAAGSVIAAVNVPLANWRSLACQRRRPMMERALRGAGLVCLADRGARQAFHASPRRGSGRLAFEWALRRCDPGGTVDPDPFHPHRSAGDRRL